MFIKIAIQQTNLWELAPDWTSTDQPLVVNDPKADTDDSYNDMFFHSRGKSHKKKKKYIYPLSWCDMTIQISSHWFI